MVRLFLPSIVKKYVNKVLADIPDYYGQVEDIDIALFRGAYVINGLYLNKVEAQTQVPFLKFPIIDISVEWKSLLKGKIVSEIYLTEPQVIYVQEDMAGEETATEEDWTKALTDLVPIDINHFEITDGSIAFVQVNAAPKIDLQVKQLRLVADNLRNVTAAKRTLPSTIEGSATSIGNGQLSLNGGVNLIKEVPDMDIELALEGVDATALNDFAKHYGSVDFEQGELGIFTELAIADGYLKGYFKMLLENAKFINREETLGEKIWEGFVSFFQYLLQNQRIDTLAVKAPLEGDLNQVNTKVWSTIGSIFKNAFIQAFRSETDDEIEFTDAFQEKDEKKGWKFWKKDKKDDTEE
ncbi:MAG: DUF748 domain-containing protein [Bacteroidota bacterium]